MSRLLKTLHRIKLGPIVTGLVKLAERLLGGGTGSLKKKLVEELMAIILRKLKEAGKEVPENTPELVDELTEQTVALLNETGGFDNITPDEPARTAAEAPAPVATAKKKGKGGRPKGSKNRPKEDDVRTPIHAEEFDEEPEPEIDLDDFSSDEFDEEDAE
jgi:hypothetical protein